LYQYPTQEQKKIVDQWIEVLCIEDIAHQSFHQLSYGQRRMILLARAMVKSPTVLIADEPCHGLDVANRRRVLKILERIGQTETNLLYITDRWDEILGCITHVMRLQKGKAIQQGRKAEVLPGDGNPT
jgi:molybdate transport system ATP-binding protein